MFGNFRGEFFGNFWGILLEKFFGGFFLAEFFGSNFLGGFFWEDFLGGFFFGEDFYERNSLRGILCLHRFVKILVFVKILSQWRRRARNLDP